MKTLTQHMHTHNTHFSYTIMSAILALLITQALDGLFVNVSTADSWVALTFKPVTFIPSTFDVSDNVVDVGLSAEYEQQLTAFIEYDVISGGVVSSSSTGSFGGLQQSSSSFSFSSSLSSSLLSSSLLSSSLSSSLFSSSSLSCAGVQASNNQDSAYGITVWNVNTIGCYQVGMCVQVTWTGNNNDYMQGPITGINTGGPSISVNAIIVSGATNIQWTPWVFSLLPASTCAIPSSSSSTGSIVVPSGANVYNVSTIAGLAQVFDGIGSLSAGGSSRLLYDYPEPYRSQILDYLFLPGYGTSHQICKVEIGGDGQSSLGTEPSHMHTATDLNYERGYEWWLMNQAKLRNPNITLYALVWSWPGWIAEGGTTPFTNSGITYLINWIQGALTVYNLTINYIGIWNEQTYTPTFIINLKAALISNNFATKIVGADQYQSYQICTDMTSNTALYNAVDVIGVHYPGPGTYPPAACLALNKTMWASEEFFVLYTSASFWACELNELSMKTFSTTISWAMTVSWYEQDNYNYFGDTGLMVANQPWSGNYLIPTVMWVQAHTTQFTRPGWYYLPNNTGSGTLLGGGTYVTITNGTAMTIIVQTAFTGDCTLGVAVSSSQNATFVLQSPFTSISFLYMFITSVGGAPNQVFQYSGTTSTSNGYFTVLLNAQYIYTFSTLNGTKGNAVTSIPIASTFPLPWTDNFTSYANNSLPKYWSDDEGSFQIYQYGTSSVLRQWVRGIDIVPQLVWGTSLPISQTVAGDSFWSDCSLSATFLIESTGSVLLTCNLPYIGYFGTSSAIVFILSMNQTYALYNTNNIPNVPPIINGSYTVVPQTWYNLTLIVTYNYTVAAINGVMVINTTLLNWRMIGFGFVSIGGTYDRFQIGNVSIGETFAGLPSPYTLSFPANINCGGEAGFFEGLTWVNADQFAYGYNGPTSLPVSTSAYDYPSGPGNQVTNTGLTTSVNVLIYRIPLPNGFYTFTLIFLDTFGNGASTWVLSATINNVAFMSTIDLYPYSTTPYNATGTVTITNGVAVITITAHANYNPAISGIQIYPIVSGSSSSSTASSIPSSSSSAAIGASSSSSLPMTPALFELNINCGGAATTLPDGSVWVNLDADASGSGLTPDVALTAGNVVTNSLVYALGTVTYTIIIPNGDYFIGLIFMFTNDNPNLVLSATVNGNAFMPATLMGSFQAYPFIYVGLANITTGQLVVVVTPVSGGAYGQINGITIRNNTVGMSLSNPTIGGLYTGAEPTTFLNSTENINCGGSAGIYEGVTWVNEDALYSFNDGSNPAGMSTISFGDPVISTFTYASQTLLYTLPVLNGYYNVSLAFANSNSASSCITNVTINLNPTLFATFDINNCNQNACFFTGIVLAYNWVLNIQVYPAVQFACDPVMNAIRYNNVSLVV